MIRKQKIESVERKLDGIRDYVSSETRKVIDEHVGKLQLCHRNQLWVCYEEYPHGLAWKPISLEELLELLGD